MLDRLPTELLLVIAELAAPLAYSRYRLVADRRSWFASLASICRSLWHRLRPLIYTEIWIFDEDEVRALASGIEHDPSFAPFTKRLFEIWVQSDEIPRSPRQSSTHVEGCLQAIFRVAPHLSVLTLPLNLGLGRSSDEIAQARAHLYAFLEQFARTSITINFHNEPPDSDVISLHPYFKTLDDFDGEGYFSDLVEGNVDDPELRNFQVVIV
ncbi:hypothetical protein RHOSPDRAFT_33602 [Rhodotorula sp. JG-1b]|nr:hypothetical protein RHOSPDRAFT_33602 [Rhodotorula sp. JG-1b]